MNEAKELDRKLLFFSVASTIVIAISMLPLARVFPMLYNTEEEIRELAACFITIQALTMPLWSFSHCCYFTRLDIRVIFATVTFSEIVKVIIGYFMVRSDIWLNNIVAGHTEAL